MYRLVFFLAIFTLPPLSLADSGDLVPLTDWEVKAVQTGGGNELNLDWRSLKGIKFHREFQGYIDFRAKFSISDSDPKELGVYLGRIGDADKVYVNGHLIGQTGSFPPSYETYLDTHREYIVHDHILKPNSKNELLVKTYVEYVGRKGINADEVQIGSHLQLQRKAYVKNLLWYLLRLGVPILCLVLAFLSMPWITTKSQVKRQILLFGVAIAYCIFGLGRSRVIFHFMELFPAYQLIVVSAMTGLVFILIYALDISAIRSKWPYVGVVAIPAAFAFTILRADTFQESAAYVKAWFYTSIPLILATTVTSLVKGTEKSIWVRIGLLCLALVATNDIFLATRTIRTVNLMDLGFCVFIICMLIAEMASLKRHWLHLSERESDLVWGERMLQMAKQVAHDIRSPLTSMRAAMSDLKGSKTSNEAVAVMNAGMDRLQAISSKLLRKQEGSSQNHSNQPKPRLTLIDRLLTDVVAEVRTGCPDEVALETEGFSKVPHLWAIVEPIELQTAISNVIRNSIEALQSLERPDKVIRVGVKRTNGSVEITIKDNGPGIPEAIHNRIFDKGFTHGKEGGSGLGLYQTKKAIEANGGHIGLISSSSGTAFKIVLEAEDQPEFVTSEIHTGKKKQILFIDDDESVLSTWRRKMGEAHRTARYFTSPSQIPKDVKNAIYVVDHRLGTEPSGFRWISDNLANPKDAILCTNEYDDPTLQIKAKQMGLRIIPKPMINGVKITT